MISIKAQATKFEEYIKNLMERFDFSDVDGANDRFIINGIQVDVVAGHENTLIIIECTMRRELGKKSIRDKIKLFRGGIKSLEDGFKNHNVYKKYKDFKYIMATKNIDIRKEDIDFANDDYPRIYLCDDNLISYYEDLYGKIKKYAKYDFLGEIKVRPVLQSAITVPAFSTNFGKIEMYSFMINPRDLLEVSYVARRETRNERFYQRIIKKERLNQIAKYIATPNNILPNNLIISFGEHTKKHVHFNPLTENYMGICTSCFGVKYGILEFPRDYRSCWIVDGQHRLYSFVHTDKVIINMPVVAFKNMKVEDQCRIFLDINKNQKPVPPDLVWDLNGDMIPSEEDGIISNTVKRLNDHGSLQYLIFIPSKGIKKKSNPLKMSGICLSLKKTKLTRESTISKIKNPFFDSDPNKTVANLSNAISLYLNCVKELMLDDWKLDNKGFVLDDGGNSVMIRLFEKISSRYIQINSKGVPAESFYKTYLKPLSLLFLREYSNKESLKKLKLHIASEGGKDAILRQFLIHIKQETGDKLFGGDIIETTDQGLHIRALEGRLKELIKTIFIEEVGDDWFNKSVPEDIYKKALRNLEKHGVEDLTKAYMQIGLGECIQIIRLNKKLFYPIFTKSEYGFGNDTELEGALRFLSRYRATQTAHDVGIDKKKHDDTLFEIYIRQIEECINSELG